MRRTSVVLLALTKMRSGFCLAGVEPETGRWIRPVKEFGGVQAGDLCYPDRTPLSVFDRIEWTLGAARPQPPHIEDWTCDFVRSRPQKKGALAESERALFLERIAEEDVSPIIVRHERSLLLASAEDFTATFTYDAAVRKLDARLCSPALGLPSPVPVTDLRWRALGRARYSADGGVTRTAAQLRADLGIEKVYLAFGLSREFEGRIWPLVIGIHCIPDYEIEVDFRNP